MKRKTYLRGFAATWLTLINLIFALITFVILFRTVFFLGTFIGSAIRAFQVHDFSLILNTLADTLASLGVSSFLSKTVPAMPVRLSFGQIEAIASIFPVVCLALLLPLLTILNGLGSFSLCFRSKGSRLLMVIHIIHAILNVLTIIATIACTVFLFITVDVPGLLRADRFGKILKVLLVIGLMVFLFLILEFLYFLYHKNIAQQMSFISSDLSDQPDYLDDNHLSGIAVFFGLAFLTMAGALGYQLSVSYSFEVLIVTALLSAYALKYLLVAAANRKLKQTIWARDRRNRR